jgi:hypothetical protein
MVRELEARLAHAPPRLAAALPWTALYAGCLGALVAWSVSVFSVTPKVGAACPRRAHAQPVACGAAPADIDWRHPDPGSLTRNPFKLLSRSEYPYAAFVWCAGEARVAGDVMEPIREIAAADGYCPALPWEPGGGEAREKARWTLHVLGVDGRMSRERLLRRLDALPKELRANQEFDAETERLYRASIVGGPDSAAHRELAERLGRSPTDSCKAIRILRTTGERETVATATRGADPDDADERDDDADDEDESAPARYSTRIAVLLASPADFDPLRRYLCDAGCEVDALPYGSMDPRLRWCH